MGEYGVLLNRYNKALAGLNGKLKTTDGLIPFQFKRIKNIAVHFDQIKWRSRCLKGKRLFAIQIMQCKIINALHKNKITIYHVRFYNYYKSLKQ